MNDDQTLLSTGRQTPELPNEQVETPCFVVFEDRVRHNLRRTAEASGGWQRLMPHVKTHRAPWIIEMFLAEGIEAFKAATLAEVEMALAVGAKNVTWAYPTSNPANIRRFVRAASQYPEALLVGMLDSEAGLQQWKTELRDAPANLRLRVDLDPGLGRTGAPMSEEALELARAVHGLGRLDGWHVYDGHVHGSRDERRAQVQEEAAKVAALRDALAAEGIDTDIVAGGSYTFDLWPADVARYVSPGSFTYSSDQHDIELAELDWQPAAFVLATVISTHEGTATLDAGVKAISPDKPLAERFRWDGKIVLMNEEHAVVEDGRLRVGDRVFLMPRHACTTAYLYDDALVKTAQGRWEYRSQLGNAR